MEQKFTFKKLLSFVIVFAMLLSSFTFLAYADEPTNVALGKEYELSGCGERASYYAKLTDGIAKDTLSYNSDEWFGFYCNTGVSDVNAPDKVGYAIIDLEGSYDISEVKVNVVDNNGGSGISKPAYVKAYLSTDNETWGEAIDLSIPETTTAGTAYSVEAPVEGTASFVKVEFGLAATFVFLNEIEVYGVEAKADDGEGEGDEPADPTIAFDWVGEWLEVDENGTWQENKEVPAEELFDYSYAIEEEGENVNIGIKYRGTLTGTDASFGNGNGTNFRIWFKNPNTDLGWDALMDVSYNGSEWLAEFRANGEAKPYQYGYDVAEKPFTVTAVETADGAEIEVVLPIEVLGFEADSFKVLLSASNKVVSNYCLHANNNASAPTKLEIWETDGIVIGETAEEGGDDEVVPYTIPVGSINAYGWGKDGYPVILGYGEGKDVVATVGGVWFEWWFKVKAEWNETEGAFVVNAISTSGNKDYEAWTLTANEIMLLVYSGTETYADAKAIIADLVVGDKLYASGFDFTNASANNLIVDGVSTVNFSNVAFEENPGEDDEPVDEGPFNYGLNIELSGDETLLIDEETAINLLTDGDWALNAEGWGGSHDGVVLVQNKTATEVDGWGMANFIWKFEGTVDPYNTIRFGLYSDVNSMIGFPTEEDVYFSNDGVEWVSGYYDLGYGETIPDAYTKFDDAEPTVPGTVIAEIKLENPQTYKYVKIEFYYPESPFTEENGYTDGTAKPRWEFFGLTEVFEFDYVEPSSVITDFNNTEYWESRYGRGAGSFAFTTAEAYQIAWDNFITSAYTQVVFAPVDGEDNVYEVVTKANSFAEFPEGGFIWVAYNSAEEGSAAEAAINLFATMSAGETYEFIGFDFENGYGEKDATVEKWEATTPEPDDATNVLLGVQFDKLTGTYYTYGDAVTDGSELTDGYYITAENLEGALYASDKVAGFGGLSGATLELEGALDATYAIDKIVVYYANGKTGSGICEPATIKAFYKNGDGEWIQFGETFVSTETNENQNDNDFIISSVEFVVDTAVEATDIRFELPPRAGKTMVFISELEAWGTEVTENDPGEDDDDEPAYKEGLTVEIDDTLVGWIGGAADLETIEGGLTDGNWGAGDANNWNNVDGVYPFQNKVCTDNTQFPEVNLIFNFGEATKFNTIDLGVYSSYNVMIGYPSALVTVYTSEDGIEWGDCYEAYLDMDIPAAGNEGSVKATAKLATALEAQFVKVVLTFPESPFESKPVWEFMGLTEIELSYVPVTSNVVTDFNPTSYKNSIGGATGAFIYDDAEIYAACANDWWIHVAFAPVADMDGYYEVVAVRAPTTGNYLTIPENGFVWMAWSSAGDTPESAGAYALDFMGNLKVGDIVEFVGVDFANYTTEADAYAEVWVDPNAPVNVALNKEYTTSGPDDTTYNANLTDGNAYGGVSYDNKWFVFNSKNTVDGIGTVIIDLDGAYSISKLAVNLINETGSGIAKPEYVKFFVSADGEEWIEVGAVELQDVQSAAYWSALEGLELEASFVKLEMKIGAPFSFMNEIEVYGKALPVEIELVEGENEITVPALNSAFANTNFENDYVITIEGQWGVTVIVNGTEYYPNRMGKLEAPLPAGENTVEFKNAGEEAAEIVAVVAAPVVGDTMDDPIILEEGGDYVADVNEQYPEGVYYQYTATEDGTVTITIKTEAGWSYVINNVTAGIYGDMHWSDDETVVITETIDVTAGDVIAIQVITYDPENPWSAPAGSVEFTLELPGESAPATVDIALGDVNMDGKIDQYDYILVKRHYFATRLLNEVELELADVNNDDVVDQYDYILLCRHYFETFTIEGTVAVPAEAVPVE